MLNVWFVSLDSEPALGTVVNLAISQLPHLFLYRLARLFARRLR